jgi:hypothetical protein
MQCGTSYLYSERYDGSNPRQSSEVDGDCIQKATNPYPNQMFEGQP